MKSFFTIIFVLLVIGFFTFLLVNEPTETQKRQYLKNKGYNEQQIDSIREKDINELAAYIMLAG
jgi:ABC-type dipeptide/oligopeptide/nickel transport system permease component